MSTETERVEAAGPDAPDFLAVQNSPEFQDLKRKQRRFIFPVAMGFLAWYGLYMYLAAYAHDFMSIRVFGNITSGLLFGLLQFVTTFIITLVYVSYANRVLDPAAEKLRNALERRIDDEAALEGSGFRPQTPGEKS
ncbi:DUF485 domain-containing protein [Arthrobacter sp. OY3WO11]|uniref:DUF485 domain-containing protein n=1 Tax=Arthrobacter sp. OY3WO11 TaxID=1835723 RepID=UPI00082BE5DF|nr:DUF485 domain-containing protein [Arthrobacter sp. OY3WO11]